MPKEFKDPSIIQLYKRKGNPKACDNHRHISVVSIACKILLNHLNEHLDHLDLPESHYGFRKDRNDKHDRCGKTTS